MISAVGLSCTKYEVPGKQRGNADSLDLQDEAHLPTDLKLPLSYNACSDTIPGRQWPHQQSPGDAFEDPGPPEVSHGKNIYTFWKFPEECSLQRGQETFLTAWAQAAS